MDCKIRSEYFLERKSTGAVGDGKHSEAIALAAFIGNGFQVALPYGNQTNWDLLVSDGGPWRSVQVKTARWNGSSFLVATERRASRRDGKDRTRPYMAGEVGHVCAVFPIAGVVWLLDEAHFVGRRLCWLHRDDAWVDGSSLALSAAAPVRVRSIRCVPRPRPAGSRSTSPVPYLVTALGSRPEWVSEMQWETVTLRASGLTPAQVGERLSLPKRTIVERLRCFRIKCRSRGMLTDKLKLSEPQILLNVASGTSDTGRCEILSTRT